MGEKWRGQILRLDLKPGEVPFDAGEIQAHLRDLVLLEMENVSVCAEDKIREGGVHTLAVRALHAQNGAVGHNHLHSITDIVTEEISA